MTTQKRFGNWTTALRIDYEVLVVKFLRPQGLLKLREG